jgi:hypothetical protein
MTVTRVTASESSWSDWEEATDLQREHFQTALGHKAWARTCGRCGEGDFVERKQKPTGSQTELRGRGFPRLPLALLEGTARHTRFRTPAGRVHRC